MKLRHLALSLAMAGIALPAFAGPATDALGNCLGENTNGRERKELAKWVWVLMAAHPEIKDLAAFPTDLRETSSATAGRLFTRLIADNCARETRAAVAADGSEAFRNAFATLGRIAMQELMTDRGVQSGFAGLERYIDKEKVERAIRPAPAGN
ncbi:MAG: hypothetical protein ACXWC6_06000 [Ramlibacter sp.]